jgi:outer membrane cobalamin receptor
MKARITEKLLALFLVLAIQSGYLAGQSVSQEIKPDSVVFTREDSLRAEAFAKLTIQKAVIQNDSATLRLFSDSAFFFKIVEHDEMMKTYHGDFADWLWHVGGFYVHDLGSYGKPITISTNGLSNRHVLILLDGIPMNEPDAGWLNLSSISLENIERIEIFRGNASPMYGDQAAAGYINIVSRKFLPGQPFTSIKFRSAFSPFGDIGIYFGRNFGSHIEAFVGGSAKETPGEQNVQGLQGGFVYNIQRTRYSGKNLFAGVNFLITPEWSMRFYTQSNKDRFDAYGRNIYGDKNVFDFSTVGGLRKDERTDYHLSVTGQNENWLFNSRLYFSEVGRSSSHFQNISIPKFYSTNQVGWDARYGRSYGRHRMWIGGSYQKRSLDEIQTHETLAEQTAIYAGDTFEWNRLTIQPSGRYEYHTAYREAISGALQIAMPIHAKILWTGNTGYTEKFPTLMDEFQNNVGAYVDEFNSAPPLDFNFPSDYTKNLSKEKLTTISSSVHLKDFIALDRIVVSGYSNRLENAVYYYPANFANADSIDLKVTSRPRALTYGIEFEVMKKIAMFEFTFRQALSKGEDEVRNGIPAYRTYLSGYGEYYFLKKNLKLTGFLSAMYVGKHAGYSFQDAPQIYFLTPRYFGGGWILNTRISAYVGDLQIFYEAENFPRIRFTMLDGYDVTRQQVRVGLIWKLYN